jgi:hypothetical protein
MIHCRQDVQRINSDSANLIFPGTGAKRKPFHGEIDGHF